MINGCLQPLDHSLHAFKIFTSEASIKILQKCYERVANNIFVFIEMKCYFISIKKIYAWMKVIEMKVMILKVIENKIHVYKIIFLENKIQNSICVCA